MEPAILVISKVSYNGYYKCYPFNRGLALVNRELALVGRFNEDYDDFGFIC